MAAWAVTEPVALDLAPPRPAVGVMREPLHGLQVQELNSAEVFHRYFGDLAN
jgi:hypothetical protein